MYNLLNKLDILVQLPDSPKDESLDQGYKTQSLRGAQLLKATSSGVTHPANSHYVNMIYNLTSSF